MADMEIVRQFNSELSTLYATKPPISKAKVTSITRLALKAVKYYKHVVQSLEKFVQKCRPEYKIPALYVVDSIIRQSRHQFGAEKDVFGPRFGRNIAHSFQNFFKCLPEEQSKLIKVLNLWQKNKVYPPEVIQPLLNMAQTRSATEQQGSPKLGDNVKAVPADTTQPIVGQMAHAAGQPMVAESPQEQVYIALLQQQQEQQMKQIRELEERLQKQQQLNQQFDQSPTTQSEVQEQMEEPRFQLPTEVFAQIQALAGMVNQPGANSSGRYAGQQYDHEGDSYQTEAYPPGKYAMQADDGYQHMQDQGYQQSFRPAFEEHNQETHYMAPQKHQGFVDDFDYGDDQDDNQRIEEKKRQLEEEASRLNTASSYERDSGMNARQRMEEQFRQQQQLVSSVPPETTPDNHQAPEIVQAKVEPDVPAFRPSPAKSPAGPRSRSRSPRRFRENDRENRDSERERDRGRERDRVPEGTDRSRQRNRDYDRSRGDRDDRDRSRGDRGERDRTRGERDERERSRGERDERDRARGDREGRDRSRAEREERDRTRVDREERDKPRERERGRELDKETERDIKEEKGMEEKKEEENEKWIPPVKEGHISVCSRTIWLGRMHRLTTKENLQELFKGVGEVQLIDMIPPRGCAYIQMAEREAAYRSLSNKQILRQNFKLAWAPAKGAKDYKEHFDKELGVTYIPVAKLQESEETISKLAEGGWIDPRTVPESERKKDEAAAAAAAASAADATAQAQAAPVLGMPMGPPPFPGIPPPGMPRFPMGLPGLPMPGMIPPGMNLPGMPPGFPPGMGNLPFQRLPMNNPFMPPFMMPGMIPGMPSGGPMPPNIPGAPFFRGNVPPPVGGPPMVNAPSDVGATSQQQNNTGEVTAQSNEIKQEGAIEPQGEQAEFDPATQASAEVPPPGTDQIAPEGQTALDTQDGQAQQFGGPGMVPGGGPPFPGQGGGPPFHGPPFHQGGPPFGQGGEPPFHGDQQFRGPPPFHEQGGPPPWRHDDGQDQWRPWGAEGEHDGQWQGEWGHEGQHDRQWGQGHFDRRGRRRPSNEEPYDRRKRGRYDEERRGPHDRRRGPPFDHRGRHFGRDHPPFEEFDRPRFGPPGRGPPHGPPHGPPFDDRPPWMREEHRHGDRFGDERMQEGREEPFVENPQEQVPGESWDAQGDDHHGNIPPLMGSQPQAPGEESSGAEYPGVPQSVATRDEEAKGWAEINELKARLAVNKNRGAVKAEANVVSEEGGQTVAAPAEDMVGVASDQSGVERKVDIAPGVMGGETASGPVSTDQSGVGETIAEVKTERSDASNDSGQIAGDSKDRVSEVQTEAVGTEMKIKMEPFEPGDVLGEQKSTDAKDLVSNEQSDESKPEGKLEQSEPKMEPSQPGDVLGEQTSTGAKGFVSSEQSDDLKPEERLGQSGALEALDTLDSGEPAGGDAAGSTADAEKEVEPMTSGGVVENPDQDGSAMAPEIGQEKMDVSGEIAAGSDSGVTREEVVRKDDVETVLGGGVGSKMGSEEATVGCEGVNVGSEGVTVGSEGVMDGSKVVETGFGDVKMLGLEEATMGSDECKMGSEKVVKGSEDVKMASEDIKMGSEEVEMGSDNVKLGSEDIKMVSEEVKMGSDEHKMGSEEHKMGSEEVEMGSDNVKMGSDDVTMESKEVEMGSHEDAIGSQADTMGSMETTKPEIVGSHVISTGSLEASNGTFPQAEERVVPMEDRTPAQVEGSLRNTSEEPIPGETSSQSGKNTEVSQVPDKEAETVEGKHGVEVEDQLQPSEAFEQLKSGAEDGVNQPDVTSSENNAGSSETTTNAEQDTASIELSLEQGVNDDA